MPTIKDLLLEASQVLFAENYDTDTTYWLIFVDNSFVRTTTAPNPKTDFIVCRTKGKIIQQGFSEKEWEAIEKSLVPLCIPRTKCPPPSKL
jgi:hypothetical protein